MSKTTVEVKTQEPVDDDRKRCPLRRVERGVFGELVSVRCLRSRRHDGPCAFRANEARRLELADAASDVQLTGKE